MVAIDLAMLLTVSVNCSNEGNPTEAIYPSYGEKFGISKVRAFQFWDRG
jgi:hypothetical protein